MLNNPASRAGKMLNEASVDPALTSGAYARPFSEGHTATLQYGRCPDALI